MKKIPYFFFILYFAALIASVNALDTAPEEYSVKKGDTLWDISNSKLNDSFLWPYVWKANPRIINPDLIYPGDRIRIPSKEELMRLPYMPEKEIPVAEEPEILETAPIAEKPKKYIVDRKFYISSGWISDEFPSIGEINTAPSNRSIFGKEDLVYLKTDEKVAVGDKFYVIRDIKKVNHPVTRKPLGHQIRITGALEVVGMDGKDKDVPKAQIIDSFEDLQIGDGLLPYSEKIPPLVPDIARTPDIRGYIVESHMNTQMIGIGDIVYLDKGEHDGLQVGDTFSALSQTPVEKSIGMIQVFFLQPNTSVAVISKTEQDIEIGDVWGKR